MAFAPLILSRFWDSGNNSSLDEIRICLKQLLAYHEPIIVKKTNKGKKISSFEIADAIAMNNVD
jgi:hypothetical protein